MRNLKKFLALVLAMMMAFSLMVTVNAASDFSAGVDEDFREAVEVLNALEVFVGDAGGFRPESYITRAEMSAVLYRIDSGDTSTTASINSGYSTFKDMGANEWFTGYVNYAYISGLIAGYEDGTFRAGNNVTGYEALTMLLRAIGYGKEDEFVGVGWRLNTANRAQKLGILDNINDGILNEPATREMVAEMAFQAIQAPTVKWTQLTSYEEQYVNTNGVVGGMSAGRQTAYSLGYINFDLQSAPGRDDFGRPTTDWSQGSTLIASVADIPVASYNGDFTGKDAKALNNGKTAPAGITSNNVASGGVWLRYNGQKWNLGDVLFTDAATAAADSAVWHNDTTGVNGYEVEVYRHVHDAGDCYSGSTLICTVKYDVIVIEPWVAVVTGVASNGTVSVAILDGGTGYNTAIGTTPALATIAKDDDLYSVVEDCEGGELFAAYWARGEAGPGERLIDLVPMEEETVTISRIDGNGTAKQNYLSTVTADDGTVYKFAKASVWTDGTNFYNPGFKATGVNKKIALGAATLYTLNGKVMVVDQTPEVPNTGFAYVLDYKEKKAIDNDSWTDDDTSTSAVYYARLQLADNSIVEVVVDKNAVNKQSRLVYYEAANVNGVETYSLYNVNGSNAELQAAGYTGRTGTSSDFKITPNVAAGVGTTPTLTDLIYDSKTLFFVATAGAGTKNDSVTVYQGIANVPALDGTADIRVAFDTTGKHVAAIQVLYATGGTDKDTYFIAGYTGAIETTETINGTEYTYYTYKAVVNGEITDVKVSKEATGGSITGVNYVQSVTYTDGIITTLGAKVDSAGVTPSTGSDTITKIKNDTVKATTANKEYYINASTVIYQYDTSGNIKTIGIGDVSTSGKTGWIVTTTSSSDVVKTLFVAK